MRNSGSARAEATAPTAAVLRITTPAAGARSNAVDVDPPSPERVRRANTCPALTRSPSCTATCVMRKPSDSGDTIASARAISTPSTPIRALKHALPARATIATKPEALGLSALFFSAGAAASTEPRTDTPIRNANLTAVVGIRDIADDLSCCTREWGEGAGPGRVLVASAPPSVQLGQGCSGRSVRASRGQDEEASDTAEDWHFGALGSATISDLARLDRKAPRIQHPHPAATELDDAAFPPFVELPIDALARHAHQGGKLLLGHVHFRAEILGERHQPPGEPRLQRQEQRFFHALVGRPNPPAQKL